MWVCLVVVYMCCVYVCALCGSVVVWGYVVSPLLWCVLRNGEYLHTLQDAQRRRGTLLQLYESIDSIRYEPTFVCIHDDTSVSLLSIICMR